MGRARVRDKLRHDGEAGHVSTQGVQVGGPVTRLAAEVEHWAGKAGQVPPDESRVVFVSLFDAIEQPDVVLGHRRVRVTHRPEIHHDTVGP